jgi:cyclophilin family peptidyl-prolyl cis-trans isomerase
VNAVADSDHVALLAIDLLGGGCPVAENVGAVLAAVADRIGRSDALSRTWHRPAHAIVSLARLDRAQAAKRLPAFVEHPVWQVRMYAARAATTLEDEATLRRLAFDTYDNVRDAAISGLSRVAGHQADDVYLAALERPDYQLVMTAARALGGTRDGERAVTAMLKALARLTAQDRDTSRDPRVALLERLRELGSAASADALVPYIGDFDPRIARLAADTLTAWTNQPYEPKTTVMRSSPSPTLQDLNDISGVSARVTIRGLGSFEMRLLSDDAPAAAARIVRLARAGYYNGLTFHRIVPNFVVQGGSPGANEYMGDGAYMRDEVGLISNLRGSVGVSTRGRDTGDAQIYVNLVDNIRLDHDFTIVAEVTGGMETVDALLEGDIIERVEIISGSKTGR